MTKRKNDNTYIKKHLVKEVSKKTGVHPDIVSLVSDAIFFAIRKNVLDYKQVWIRRFGRFELKRFNKKKAQNIVARKAIIIPEHYKFFFYPTRTLKATAKLIPVKKDLIFDEKIAMDLDEEDLKLFNEAAGGILPPDDLDVE